MLNRPLKVLVISELFPNPSRPAFGIFVERQMHYMIPYCRPIVVAPVRVFPPLRIWRELKQPRKFKEAWQKWRSELAQIPDIGEVNGLPVHYPHYSSLPKQGFHSLWGFFAYFYLQKDLRRLNEYHQFDLIHAHYASPCGVIALLAQRWMQVPVVVSIHGGDVTYTAKQNWFGAKIIKRVFEKVDAVVANSSWTQEKIIHYGGKEERITIVRYGAIPPVHTLKGTIPKTEIVNILSVGYLEERKGHAYVLKVVANLINRGYQMIRYVIVGDGSQKKYLQDLAQELGISQYVVFEGYKAHEDVWPYFQACDVFVLPSWDEAFGVVYIEALSLAKPVIACQGEGGPEDLKSLGDCVTLVKSRDVNSLEQALRELIDSPEQRKKMGVVGQKIVNQYFDWEGNARGLLDVYEKALETHHVQ